MKNNKVEKTMTIILSLIIISTMVLFTACDVNNVSTGNNVATDDNDVSTDGNDASTDDNDASTDGNGTNHNHSHTYNIAWSFDDENHWHGANCEHNNEKSDVANHSFSWLIDVVATTSMTGIKHEECDICGYKKADVLIPKIESTSMIINHSNAQKSDLFEIESSDLVNIKNKLNIAYFHTSHGNQLIEGSNAVEYLHGEDYDLSDIPLYSTAVNDGIDAGTTDIETSTRNYLTNHPNVNVVMWAWCGQLCWLSTEHVNQYLTKMSNLENEYPNIVFVYMTGHLFNSNYGLAGDGRIGTEAINTANNTLIRNYCIENEKCLYDFEDIECYDPNGVYFGDKHANDNCDYDSDENGTLDKNWANDWQNSHLYGRGNDWVHASAYGGSGYSHTQPINAISKAYAFWVMLHKIAIAI